MPSHFLGDYALTERDTDAPDPDRDDPFAALAELRQALADEQAAHVSELARLERERDEARGLVRKAAYALGGQHRFTARKLVLLDAREAVARWDAEADIGFAEAAGGGR